MALFSDFFFEHRLDPVILDSKYLEWVQGSFEFAEKHHFDAIEVIIEHPLNTSALEEFVRICNGFHMPKTIHAPFLEHNLMVMDQIINRAALAEYLQIIDIAAAIKAQNITYHTGAPIKMLGFLYPCYRQILLQNAAAIAQKYQEYSDPSFQICFENMPQMVNFFGTTGQIREYFDTTEFSGFKMTLDTSHGWTMGGDQVLEELIKTMKDKIVHTHFVDNITFDNDPHIAVGTGKIDFQRILKTLQEVEYSGYITIEVMGAEAALKSKEYLDQIYK
jgi:sugar phosphate isomerase/epimerase